MSVKGELQVPGGGTKYILVSGGVISGIGKGVITSSIGTLLKSVNLHVTAIKIDPYLNIDAGTFSPYEHGKDYKKNQHAHVWTPDIFN